MSAKNGKNFRLARVLHLRHQQVEVCRDHLESCRSDLERWQAHHQEILAQQQAAGLQPGASEGLMDAAQLQLREQGRRWFQRELERLAVEIREREQALETARAELWAAEQRRLRLERLRERFEEQQHQLAKRGERKRLNRWTSHQSGTQG
ncbi:hypothetical protein [Thiohalorhabdus methylotrophus]|uniref:Flagellar FliJ protein n=1 Tax=Thiohalorhabdus methylotrophus TaxID=3242694 RepID=A0ABV4TW82_9GAMM